MFISSGEPTFLLKFMQDPLSLLQLIAEPRAIILKRQSLSLIFVLHYIFFFVRGCNVSRGGQQSLIHHSLPGGSLLFYYSVLITVNLPTHITHEDRFFIVPEIKTSLSYISTTIINGNVPGLHHHKHQSSETLADSFNPLLSKFGFLY